MKYRVLMVPTIEALAIVVEKHIMDGWKISGSMSVCNNDGFVTFYQPMTKNAPTRIYDLPESTTTAPPTKDRPTYEHMMERLRRERDFYRDAPDHVSARGRNQYTMVFKRLKELVRELEQ